MKIDIEAKGRRFEEAYPSDTPEGVVGLLLNRNEVRASAEDHGNFDAVVALVDLDAALANTELSERERSVIDLIDRWSIEEIASMLGVADSAARTFLRRGAEKLSAHLAGANDGS